MIFTRYEGKYQYEILTSGASYLTVIVKNLYTIGVDVQTTINRTKSSVPFYSFTKNRRTNTWFGRKSGRPIPIDQDLSETLEGVVQDWRLRLLENILN